MNENEIAAVVVDAAFHIHQRLGPGLLESLYRSVLTHELRKRGLHVEIEVPVTLTWDEQPLELGFRADLVVQNLVIIELKAVEKMDRVCKRQLLTYLKVADKRLGLLINFGEELFKDGIFRVANQMPS